MREEFMITKGGKRFVLFEGLLDAAHTQGLEEIHTELLQVPDPSNADVAIVKATVRMEDGRKFSGLGDASPQNAARHVAAHIIRLAETRAKARALRDAVNVGVTALEELSETGEAGADAGAPRPGSARRPDNVRPMPTRRGERPARKARKSEVELLRTLAVEWAGDGGVERLEGTIGKPLPELTGEEAQGWTARLTPGEAGNS